MSAVLQKEEQRIDPTSRGINGDAIREKYAVSHVKMTAVSIKQIHDVDSLYLLYFPRMYVTVGNYYGESS